MYPNIDEPKDLVNGLASSSTNTSCHFECLFHSLSDNVSREQTARHGKKELRCEKRRAKSVVDVVSTFPRTYVLWATSFILFGLVSN
jgi:hypothetical protein